MSHFTRVKHSKMLARIQAAQLEGDEIAVAMIAFLLMCERDGPISDDMPWLGRKCGVSTHRARKIRAKLIDAGVWQARDGMIGDKFALDEVIYRAGRTEVARSNAMARWEKADGPREPELNLENGAFSSDKPQKTAKAGDAIASPGDNSGDEPGGDAKSGEKAEKKAVFSPEKRAKEIDLLEPETAENRQSDPEICIPDSHARATRKNPEERESCGSQESEASPAIGRSGSSPIPVGEQTFDDQLASICLAAGFNPQSDRAIAEARKQLQRWQADGISVERTILPVVRSVMARTDDPTSSLYRFDRLVRLEHARITATPTAKAQAPPATAMFEFPDEPERFVAMRQDLCDALGPTAYCALAHAVRFEQIDDTAIVRVNSAPGAVANSDQRFKDRCLSALTHVARRHGFNQVW